MHPPPFRPAPLVPPLVLETIICRVDYASYYHRIDHLFVLLRLLLAFNDIYKFHFIFSLL